MTSKYQEFVRKAKERFAENQKKKLLPKGGIAFTAHARYKMSQYGLSEQKVKGIIRNPKRTEVGIVPKTVAVMQPASTKVVDGKTLWKQEIWVMYVLKGKRQKSQVKSALHGSEPRIFSFEKPEIRIISAWRYPGVSPKRSPIPADILQELASGDILEAE